MNLEPKGLRMHVVNWTSRYQAQDLHVFFFFFDHFCANVIKKEEEDMLITFAQK